MIIIKDYSPFIYTHVLIFGIQIIFFFSVCSKQNFKNGCEKFDSTVFRQDNSGRDVRPSAIGQDNTNVRVEFQRNFKMFLELNDFLS